MTVVKRRRRPVPGWVRDADRERIGPHVRDLTGEVVNTLEVGRYVRTLPQGSDEALQMAVWECRCKACGGIEAKQRRHIVDGTASCGRCSRRIRKDITGQRFGRWTIAALGPSTERGESQWLCRCDCAEERLVRRSELVNGDSRSCGCLRRETTARNQAISARKRRRARAGLAAP